MLMKCQLNPRRPFARLSLLFLFFLMACGIGPSHFTRSYDVSDTFENFKLIDRYQYYFNGLPSNPDAVVGIEQGYELKSSHWHPVDLDDRRLRHMVEGMLNNPGAEYNTEPNGAYIYNHKREVIGIWYSVWRLPLVTFMSESEFAISHPVADFPRSNKDPEDRFFRPFSLGH